jgi:hypothetical protein
MLPACRPNFVKVAFTTCKVDQAKCRDNTVILIFRADLFASGLGYIQFERNFCGIFLYIQRQVVIVSNP